MEISWICKKVGVQKATSYEDVGITNYCISVKDTLGELGGFHSSSNERHGIDIQSF